MIYTHAGERHDNMERTQNSTDVLSSNAPPSTGSEVFPAPPAQANHLRPTSADPRPGFLSLTLRAVSVDCGPCFCGRDGAQFPLSFDVTDDVRVAVVVSRRVAESLLGQLGAMIQDCDARN